MAHLITRRATVRRRLAAAGALALMPKWALPALHPVKSASPFTDVPPRFNVSPPGRNNNQRGV
jgi:hypothetical protein